jgi:hypothetical protein
MKAPVFIVGCPRSGTSFLYHLLLSAGGFAHFRTQMNAYDVLEPIYGNLGVARNKERAVHDWLRSKAFLASGVNPEIIEKKILVDCRSAGDFLRIVMDEVAREQKVDRWIDSTPTNVSHILRIHRDFPNALFIHIIRDGRDVALSLDKRSWTRPLPWDKKRSLAAAGLYWEWIVKKGRKNGVLLASNYLEIRYEDLVLDPRKTLIVVAQFIKHDLDYDRIQQASVGSVRKPLTAFKEDLSEGRFSPVGRWKEKFPADQLAEFEALVGRYLTQLGYKLSGNRVQSRGLGIGPTRLIYGGYHELKQWAKIHTPLSRLTVDYAAILIDK